MISRYTSPKVKEPSPELWSNCIVCDGIAYIAGLTSRNSDGVTIDGADEYDQTKIIFNMKIFPKKNLFLAKARKRCSSMKMRKVAYKVG